MRKLTLAVALCAGAIGAIVVAPAAAVGEAPQPRQKTTAETSGGLLRIGGPRRLPARRKLRVPIRCSAVCRIVARPKLLLPGRDVRFRAIRGQMSPSNPKDLRLVLNRSATRILKSRVGRARLRVRVVARNARTGVRDRQTRRFKFKRG